MYVKWHVRGVKEVCSVKLRSCPLVRCRWVLGCAGRSVSSQQPRLCPVTGRCWGITKCCCPGVFMHETVACLLRDERLCLRRSFTQSVPDVMLCEPVRALRTAERPHTEVRSAASSSVVLLILVSDSLWRLSGVVFLINLSWSYVFFGDSSFSHALWSCVNPAQTSHQWSSTSQWMHSCY